MISVITICYNEGASLRRTIDSVIQQEEADYEYIVIDGASDDDQTKSILDEYKDHFTKFISEEDEGVYDAMNKGVANASGEFVIFLNAGDHFVSAYSLRSCISATRNKRKADVFFGQIVWVDKEKGINSASVLRDVTHKGQLYYGNFPHPATLYRRSLFKDYGGFDTSYKLLGDYDWNLRLLIQQNVPFFEMASVISVFYTGGISNATEYSNVRLSELNKLRQVYFSKKPWISNDKVNGLINRVIAKISDSRLNRVW